MKRLGSAFALSSSAVWLALVGSCTSQSSPYDDLPWTCFEDPKGCTCYGGTRAEGAKDSRPPTTSCQAALDCCFVIDHGDGGYECLCIETPPDESESGGAGAAGAPSGAGGEGDTGSGLSAATRCTRAATEHDTTEVVTHCPPVTLDSSAVCSVIFESCDPEYLKKNGLIACCDGLVCQEDPNGQLVCVESGDDQGS